MDPLTIGMLVIFAVLLIVMFRGNKKRAQQAQEIQSKTVPGAKVMTTFGVYGTIVEIDEADGTVLVESTPGTVLKVHRQAIGKVIDDTPAVDAAATPVAALEDEDGEPKYGLRADESTEPTAVEITDATSADDDDAKGDSQK